MFEKVPFKFHGGDLLGRVEPQAHRIDAVPLPGGLLGTVVKDMAQMAATVGTEGLGAGHAMGRVTYILNGPFHGLVKGRPPTLAFEFVDTFEEQGIACPAMVVALVKMQVVLTGMRSFCAFLAQYVIFLRGQVLLPLSF